MNLLRRHKKNKVIAKVLLLIAFFIIISFQILYIPPTYQIHFLQFRLPILYVFFISVFGFLLFLGELTFNNKKHGLFLGLFVVFYLNFRLFNLNHPLFLFLLIGLFLIVELIFAQFNSTKPK